jgi:hypothetical protein
MGGEMIERKEYLGPMTWIAAGLTGLVTVLAALEGRATSVVIFGLATLMLLARQWRARKQG